MVNKQADRRVLLGHDDIVDIWRSVVEDCDNENVISEDFLQGQQCMCRGSFSAHSRYLALKKKDYRYYCRCIGKVSSILFQEVKTG